jgi:DNA-directed RNA polymerase specialized sigma24 family protein
VHFALLIGRTVMLLSPNELLDAFHRGRMRYDKGWAPGPNALWAHKSPDDMAKELSGDKKANPGSSVQNDNLIGTQPTTPNASFSPPNIDSAAKAEGQKGESKQPKIGESITVKGERGKVIGEGKNNVKVKMPDGRIEKVRFRDRANEPKFSLREIVKKNGGINIGSLEAHGFDVKNLMESGLQYRGLFRREGGKDVSEMASQLHNEGHLISPGGTEEKGQMVRDQGAAQHLIDQMLSHARTSEDQDKQIERELKARWKKEKEDAKRDRFTDAEIAGAERTGQADGAKAFAEGRDGSDDSELADEKGDADESGFTGDVGAADEHVPFQLCARAVDGHLRYSTDAQGHEHKGTGPGGGQFTGKESPDDMAKSLTQGSLFGEEKEPSQNATLTGKDVPASGLAAKPFEPVGDAAKPDSQLAIQPFSGLGETPKPSTVPGGTVENPNEKAAIDPVALKRAKDLVEGLPKSKSGYPLAVEKAVNGVMGKGWQDADRQDAMGDASARVLAAFAKEQPREPEGLASTVAQRAAKDFMTRKSAKLGSEGKMKQIPENHNPADKRTSGDMENMNAMHEAIGNMQGEHKAVIQSVLNGNTTDQIAEELGIDRSKAHRLKTQAIEALREVLSRNEWHGEKNRYAVQGPILPQVWDEIIKQSQQFGIMGSTFVRCVMEAMRTSDSQYEAIMKGRQMFLSGQRYEYGPRHSPPKRLDGAVARLEALAEYAGEIDDEALEDEVTGIAREFSAEDLKEVARKFGIKRGIGTKAKTLASLLEKVCEGKVE